ncbi:MAG: 2,3-bisphosphoglycerate-independent phosphoglycerate mutase [Desulfobacteraceae bacterium]|jgi:2,3-bisphosphoglycerate-independent phosphoglycerate mutase
MTRPKPCLLMILDGWGIRPETAGNAVAQARTPNLTALQAAYPHTRLLCAGEAVGLPAGIMGNSEVGHLNIGAGRVVYQDLLRIDRAVANGDLARNPVVLDLCQRIRTGGGALHLMGLVSDGGVHSQLRHLLALLEIARAQGLPRVFVHAILDGRDTPPDSGLGYLEQVQAHIARHAHGALATICGRFYAMDRDSRWERTEIAYRLYTEGEGQRAVDPLAAVGRAYDAAETDEFVRPIVLTGPEGRPRGLVADNDGVLFFNFRADRARQITRAFTDRAFDGFQRRRLPALRGYACMTRYDEAFDLPVVFPPEKIRRVLGEVLSRAGLTQLRIAETEKYAHVTYFFNGGDETPFAGEDRFLVPSPKEVPTYDFKPEMSAPTVTREVLARIAGGRYDVIVLNFANMDMVGHTGVLPAAIAACEAVDTCVGQIVDAVRSVGGAVLLTADHGNAELMANADGSVHTAHTLNPVPFILIDDRRRAARLRPGSLADIAPTLLDLMGIDRPPEMTGESLLQP